MRLLSIILSVIGVLIVAALVGPSFVDWNKHKPKIVAEVKKATGLDIKIDGDLSLAILPTPHAKIENLTVAAPQKIQFENLLTMKSADVSIALLPLLQKKVQVSTVTLIEPDIQVEILPDGTPSWQTAQLAAGNNAPMQTVNEAGEVVVTTPVKEETGTAKKSDAFSLDALKVEGGKLAYIDHRSNARYAAQDINLDVEAKTLKGPFELDGDLVYQEKRIAIDIKTGKMPTKNEPLTVNAEISMPEADSSVKFDGLATIAAPFDVQGQTNIKIKSPRDLASLFGVTLSEAYDQNFALDGLLSATEDGAAYNDLKVSFGSFVGNGKISIQDLKVKDPVRISGSIKSSSMLDLDPFMKAPKAAPKTKSESESLKASGTGTASAAKGGLVPQTLTLPMAMDVDMRLDLAGLKVKGQEVKGLFVDLKKVGATSNATFKVLEVPGQGRVDGTMKVAFASQSKSPKTGQIVYADPTATYQVNGQIAQLEKFLDTFAPDANTDAVTNLYKSAQFDLQGSVSNSAVSLKDSTLKLDQMVVGLGGRYQPAHNGGRAKATIDVSAGSVDFDRIMQAQGGKKAKASSDKSAGDATAASGAKVDAKEALKPIQNFELPLDLTFDVSLQQARINGADLQGLRLTGDMTGKRLTLSNASVNDFAGASASVKGQVANLSDLSGIDLSVYTKTADVQKLLEALKVDGSKLPKGLSALEATATGKGSVDNLAFATNVTALGGQLQATGNAAHPLDKPAFDNLTVRVKHPNMVKAIQIVSPEFKGQDGLAQAVDFYTKASSNGSVYTLSDMKATLGTTNFGGNLKIDTGSKVKSVRGTIQAGNIALDDLLGAKPAAKSSGGGGNAASTPTPAAGSTSGRWSKTPIDLGWMKTVDVDVALSASSITYGKWNFTQPSTNLKIANGQMNVDDLKAGVFGGQATLTSQVNAEPMSLSVDSNMANIDLESLVKALSGSSRLQSAGTVSFKMGVKSTGGSAYALVNGLNGSADLDGRNVILKGFDLAKLARGLAVDDKLASSFTSLIDGALSGGQTQFDTITGDYKITNGQVDISKMEMDGPAAVIASTGYANIPQWFINVDNTITLKNVPDLKPFNVKIKGPIDNPGDTFGKNILEDYLQDKLKRKVVKELPGILGDDVTDKLQKFGILPQQQKQQAPVTPSEVPAEGATDGATEAAPSTTEQPVQQQEQPQQQQPSKEEELIKGVLDGLLR